MFENCCSSDFTCSYRRSFGRFVWARYHYAVSFGNTSGECSLGHAEGNAHCNEPEGNYEQDAGKEPFACN